VFHRLFDPIGQLIFGLDDIQRAVIGLARLVGVIELAPGPVPGAGPASGAGPGAAGGASGAAPGVDLAGVGFRYATTGRGIADVTLRIDPATTVAFVGSSGSGKSTLARVIAGHHPPDAGSVRIDPPAVPFYISQELHQFRGGIAANMRLVAPEASDAEIADALRAVGADWALPDVTRPDSDVTHPDLDATHSEPVPIAGAEPLDEGRIQQLAIARALLADAPLVILDEATADVGLQHRDAVEGAIEVLRRDRTTILIAHRLQPASTADRIAVFSRGSIVQCGTHQELLARPGPYREFWRAQAPTPHAAAVTGLVSRADPALHPDPVSHPDPDPETEAP
jgi:ATP-binding cassette subfamily C protein